VALNRREIAAFALLLTLGTPASVQLAAGKKKENSTSVAPQMAEQKRALHALNRLTFGAGPGDVQKVTAIGVDKWIDQQLHPEKLDDSALEARLTQFRTLRMSTRELVEAFPPPQVIKAIMDGKQSLPSDPAKRAIYQAQLDRLEQKRERKQDAAENLVSAAPSGPPQAPAPAPGPAELAKAREDKLYADIHAEQLLSLPPDQRVKEILKMTPEERHEMVGSFRGAKGQQLLDGLNPQQKETLMALNNPQQVVTTELMQAKLLRAIYSERQLDEVMTDFWFNHFNVFIGKGSDRYLLTSYERDVIRPHALGKFEDLLVATARSPAMLFYLDNWLSVGPNSDIARGVPKNPARRRLYSAVPAKRTKAGPGKRSSGLNENYGRELMELHTLGVNGGYTQKDVTEVARVFTGWTLERPQDGAGFKFESRMHDPGDKSVLGHKIKNHGEKEGIEVLHLLAHNPSTARFISTKLAMRFVSDNPPASLVSKMQQTYLKKDGDIREVLRTMFRSPEFWADDTYRAKVKTPLEFMVSAVRATDADVTNAMPLLGQLNNMGMPLFGMQPPTGYSMKAETWVNSSALLGRMNFALALSANRLKGITVQPEQLFDTGAKAGDAQQVLVGLENSFLGGDVSRQTHETISRQLNDPQVAQRRLDDPIAPPNVSAIAGLILGSPEFQRR